MSNLKDTLTTICGLLFVVCGAVLGVRTEVVMPNWIISICIITMAICGAVSMYLSGKNADGSTKTTSQIEAKTKERGVSQ